MPLYHIDVYADVTELTPELASMFKDINRSFHQFGGEGKISLGIPIITYNLKSNKALNQKGKKIVKEVLEKHLTEIHPHGKLRVEIHEVPEEEDER